MPKLWNETIAAHRRDVRDAILHTTAALVAEHGPLSVTMSQVAEETGIGRATLYKYFPDVESILLAWHEWQITRHLDHLVAVRDGTPEGRRLRAVLEAYAGIQQERIQHRHREAMGDELAAFLHRDEQVADARQQVHEMLRELISEAASGGDVRSDVGPDELATFCLHALTAAGELRSKAAARRLVSVVLDGLRAPAGG